VIGGRIAGLLVAEPGGTRDGGHRTIPLMPDLQPVSILSPLTRISHTGADFRGLAARQATEQLQ
jgi:hypothetical protein